MSESPLRITYLNIQGLRLNKLEPLLNTYLPNSDLIFLAETWFLNLSALQILPGFVIHTPIAKFQQRSRQSGGMVCLCNPLFWPCIRRSRATPYAIVIETLSLNVVSVYVPPSADAITFSSSINVCADADLLIGDVNTDFGPEWGGIRRHPPERLTALGSLCTNRDLRHVPPSQSPHPKLDHVFARVPIVCHYATSAAPIPTDHLTLRVEASNPTPSSDTPEFGLARYYIRSLTHPRTCALIRGQFEALVPRLSMLLEFGIRQIAGMDLLAKKELVSHLDQLVLDAFALVSASALGVYTVGTVRQSPDRILKLLNQCNAVPEAVKLFKRSQRGSASPMVSRDPNISPAEDAIRHFSDIFTQPNEPLQGLPAAISDHLGSDASAFAEFFSRHQVSKAIRRYPKTVSCGADSIHARILDVLDPTGAASVLSLLFRVCLAAGVTPARWNTSIVCPIPKKETSTHIDAFRPIALTEMFRRLFEKCLLRALERSPAVSEVRHFCPMQAGFRRGFSTQSHALYSHEVSLRHPLHHVFIDFKAAYDTVPMCRVLQTMQDRNAPNGLLSLITSLFTSGGSRIVVNGRLTPVVPKERGLFQGSILSPFLFDLFVDPVAWELHRSFPVAELGYHVALFFADDIKLHHENPAELQRAVSMLSQWSQANGMSANLAKCGYFSPASDQFDHAFLWNGSELPKVESYTYLGFPHLPSGIDIPGLVLDRCAKVERSFGSICAIADGWPAITRLTVYRTFLRSQLDYGLPLLRLCLAFSASGRERASQALQALTAIHTRAMAWCIGIRNHTGMAAAITSISSPQDRMTHLVLRFAVHIRESDPTNPIRLIRPWSMLNGQVHRLPSDNTQDSLANRLTFEFFARPLPLVPAVAGQPPPTLVDRIRAFHYNCFSRTPTMQFITPDARCRGQEFYKRSNPACDRVLRIADQGSLVTALSWRCSTAAFRLLCQCGSQFGRSHIDGCGLLDDFPCSLAAARVLFERDKVKWAFHPGSEYSLLDCLLNHGWFDLFEQAYWHVLSHCSRRPPQPRAPRSLRLTGIRRLASPALAPWSSRRRILSPPPPVLDSLNAVGTSAAHALGLFEPPHVPAPSLTAPPSPNPPPPLEVPPPASPVPHETVPPPAALMSPHVLPTSDAQPPPQVEPPPTPPPALPGPHLQDPAPRPSAPIRPRPPSLVEVLPPTSRRRTSCDVSPELPLAR